MPKIAVLGVSTSDLPTDQDMDGDADLIDTQIVPNNCNNSTQALHAYADMYQRRRTAVTDPRIDAGCHGHARVAMYW